MSDTQGALYYADSDIIDLSGSGTADDPIVAEVKPKGLLLALIASADECPDEFAQLCDSLAAKVGAPATSVT